MCIRDSPGACRTQQSSDHSRSSRWPRRERLERNGDCGADTYGSLFSMNSPSPPGRRVPETLYDRVEMANSWRTEIHMCLHHNHHSSPIARGAATCLLYTSDAADDLTRVDLGGRR